MEETAKRVIVIGCSGSGKTTLAKRIAGVLGAPHVELDGLYHRPGWKPLPEADLRARLGELVTAPKWVIDGNYFDLGMGDVAWPVADTVVWLDLPRSVVMRQIVRRTVVRTLTRRTLWNGNREPLSNFTSLDPEKNIMLWAWTRHGPHRSRCEALVERPENAHLRVTRLRSRREVARFAGSLDGSRLG